jgi:tripartite-type tricarboxylate transporter receptor subunit TctC
MNRFAQLLLASCIACAGLPASAQEFPAKQPIKLVVPFAPGGSTDVIARIVAPALGRSLGQTVVIENKPGGGGVTATLDVLRSPPDGYTLALATASTTSANPAINPRAPYGPNDLTAIVNLAATPTVIAVHPGFPAKDFAGFVAELKRHPGKYSYASSGVGGISHLQMETFKSVTSVFVTHIPYRGAGPALNDAMGGQVQIVMDALPSALPLIKTGKLRAMVVTSPKRLPGLPDVPTLAEVGLAAMNRMSVFGIVGPKALPPEVVRKINAAARTALEDAAVRQRIEESGAVPVGGTSEQYASDIAAEFNQLKRVVEQQKLSLEGG